MRHRHCFILLVILVLFSFPDATLLDRIVAVVDDQIVLESELNETAAFTYQSLGKAVPSSGSPEFEAFRRNVLDRLIEDKLLLKQAEADSITVSHDEVLRQRDAQIDQYIQKLGSKEALEEELRKSYGLSLAKLKKNLEDQINEQMLKMRVTEAMRLKNIPTRDEVEKFYQDYRDSLPKEKSSIHLAHIMKEIQPSAAIVGLAEKRIRAVEEELFAGKPFDVLAKKYSEDPASAEQGGDLGFFQKGLLDVSFEKAAFALGVGEVSRIVRSSYGFHLIKMEERKDNQIRVRHILILVRPSSADTLAARQMLDSLRKTELSDSAFIKAAQQFSDDKLTRQKGGDLGWVSGENLNEDYKKAIAELKAGDNSEPVLIRGAFHLFRVLAQVDERPLSLEQDYETLRTFCENYKLKKELQALTDRLRKKVFVENRLDRP